MKKVDQEPIVRYESDPSFGLTDEQVKSRQEQKLFNVAKSPTNKSYLQIILGNVFTGFNILMFAIGVLLLIVVGPKVVTNLMYLLIIIFNTLIGTIQECKSKQTIEKLKLLNDSKIKVRRNGKDIDILPSEIVLDDVVILNPGDQIPADCLILEKEILEVNESLLTGESVPVKKSLGEMIYAGSFVVSGSLAVRATKIANDTYIQSIENKAKQAKAPKSRLMQVIKRIIDLMTAIAIPLAIIVFINELLHNIQNPFTYFKDGVEVAAPMIPTFWGEESNITNAIFYGGTTIAYMIPCGMALLASVAMATGVVKLASVNTLASNLYSVESLSRVDTLCLDKTGTLTDGTMTVEDYKVLDDKVDVEKLIGSYLGAFKANNQTSTAMINRFATNNEYKITQTIQFSSARKYSAVKFEGLGWFALGAPDYLTEDKELLKEVLGHASNGLRVILLAKIDEEFKDEDTLPKKKHNVAMFIIRDTIRPEVKDTMLWFSENDVDIRVISGDTIGTVSYIAKQSGIKHWDKAIDLSTLTEDDDFEEVVLSHWIFGRVTPDQKAEIIAILKKYDRVVGVTGDGLNDLLAFKQADCSIALANGAAATKNVANLILLDSNFGNMKEAVFQGRRVVNNIQRSSTLFVMKDFLWLFITLLPILMGVNHIIQPTVMTIVNIFITGIASVFVALEPDKTRVKGNFYNNVVVKAIGNGLYMFIPVLTIMLYFVFHSISVTGSFSLNDMKTMFDPTTHEIVAMGWIPLMALCVAIGGFIIFFDNCRPFTKFRRILYSSTLAVVLIVLYLAPEFFIVSGTDMLESLGGNGVFAKFGLMFKYIFGHVGNNAQLGFYRTMNLEQGMFLLAWVITSYPIYLIIKKSFKYMGNKFFPEK